MVKENEKIKEDLFEMRINEQKQKCDYADKLEDGSLECCDDCGALINSHDHCPKCDY